MLRLSIRSREKPDVRARRVLVTPPGGHRHRRHRPLGLSKREGLAAARLYYWRKRLNAANSKDPALPGGRFITVQLPQRNEDSGCQLPATHRRRCATELPAIVQPALAGGAVPGVDHSQDAYAVIPPFCIARLPWIFSQAGYTTSHLYDRLPYLG